MIKQIFPNLNNFLQVLTEAQGGSLVSSDDTKLSYRMPVLTFGQHMGDNWINLERDKMEYRLTLESKVGKKVRVKTYSNNTYTLDLDTEEWDQEVNELIQSHWSKEEYLDFSSGMSAQKFMRGSKPNNSGCFVLLMVGLFSIIMSFIV